MYINTTCMVGYSISIGWPQYIQVILHVHSYKMCNQLVSLCVAGLVGLYNLRWFYKEGKTLLFLYFLGDLLYK